LRDRRHLLEPHEPHELEDHEDREGNERGGKPDEERVSPERVQGHPQNYIDPGAVYMGLTRETSFYGAGAAVARPGAYDLAS